MPSAELSRRVEKVVGERRREFHEALRDADSFEDLPGNWHAAILEAEQNRPKLRVIRDGQWWFLAGLFSRELGACGRGCGVFG